MLVELADRGQCRVVADRVFQRRWSRRRFDGFALLRASISWKPAAFPIKIAWTALRRSTSSSTERPFSARRLVSSPGK
jgi:hypothetical protein